MKFCNRSIIGLLRSDRSQKKKSPELANVKYFLTANNAPPPSLLSPPVTLLTWIYFLFESQSHWLLDILPAVTISKLLNSWPSFVLNRFSYEALWYICHEYWMVPPSLRTREWFLFTPFSKTHVQLAVRTRRVTVTSDACTTFARRCLYPSDSWRLSF